MKNLKSYYDNSNNISNMIMMIIVVTFIITYTDLTGVCVVHATGRPLEVKTKVIERQAP